MANFRKRYIWLSIAVIVIGAVAYLIFSNYELIQNAPVGTGFMAKILCSGVFISGRDPEAVIEEDCSFHPNFSTIKTKIDFEKREVTASLFGFFRQKAIFHDQLGAILLSGERASAIRSWKVKIPEAYPPNPEEISWPTGDLLPEEDLPLNIDADLLAEALDRPFVDPYPENPMRTRAVLIVYDGKLIGERYAPGFNKNMPLIGWSMTKSITNALVGILVHQGKLSLQDPAPVPEWQTEEDPRKNITIDQLLRMSSGLEFEEEYATKPLSDINNMLFRKGDMAAYAASMPLEVNPDEKWSYSSGTSLILSRIIRSLFDQHEDYLSFPRMALFNKIGMRSAVLETDSSGTFVGSSFCYATARDWARFGLLYLNDGVWEGKRILPEAWVEYTMTPTPKAPRGRYGAHFHLNRGQLDEPQNRLFPNLPSDLYFAYGYQEQYVVIIPSKKLVIVRLGMSYQGSGWDLEGLITDVIKAIGDES
jgi:CubicO group peptidase (beta-lactamase class C family)